MPSWTTKAFCSMNRVRVCWHISVVVLCSLARIFVSSTHAQSYYNVTRVRNMSVLFSYFLLQNRPRWKRVQTNSCSTTKTRSFALTGCRSKIFPFQNALLPLPNSTNHLFTSARMQTKKWPKNNFAFWVLIKIRILQFFCESLTNWHIKPLTRFRLCTFFSRRSLWDAFFYWCVHSMEIFNWPHILFATTEIMFSEPNRCILRVYYNI